ncbi:MAG: aminotransferase class I/II-fold pyridoxal phosphate-dependent enzyme [Xanthobacteraceae bacterium]
MTERPNAYKPRTIAAQALGTIEPETHGVALPVHVSTTFIRDPDNQYRTGYSYGRPDNATVRQTEAVIAALEGAHEALLFGSGMAAATSVVLALPPGSHVLAPQVCYWGLRDWLKNEAPLFGYRVDLIDMSNVEAVRAAMQPDTKLLWIETPANPLWTITDISGVAEIAHAGGAILGIDSTAATPLFTKPLTLGADIVMHSATKYLNGHSDVVAGVLAAARDDALWTRIKQVRSHHGAILGPFEAWLLLRGLRTLEVRVHAQTETAAALATRFANHQSISSVLYPGLPTHPGHAVAARQMCGFGGMLSIRVKGGERAAIDAAARVKLWKRATSLGGVESLIEHRASIEGPGSPCPPDLLRLSVGLEDPDDLYDDLDRALRAANG